MRWFPDGSVMFDLKEDDPRYDNLGYFSWAAAQRRQDTVAIIDLSGDRPVEISYRPPE